MRQTCYVFSCYLDAQLTGGTSDFSTSQKCFNVIALNYIKLISESGILFFNFDITFYQCFLIYQTVCIAG